MIGVVSHEDDLHAQHVRGLLDSRGIEHVLIDTGALPGRAAVTSTQEAGRWSATWDDPATGTVVATDLRVMWWRRPQPFTVPGEVSDPQDRHFALGECAAFVAGLWTCLDAVWVNDPDRDEAASRKMSQLKLAAALGFTVPATCMTSDPARAREFIAAQHAAGAGVVFKPFSGTEATWRETRPVREEDLALLAGLRHAPVIFQEYVPGGVDIRATVVGDQVFAASTRAARDGYEYDFRLDGDAAWYPYILPDGVRSGLLRMCRRMGIWYGAADLRLAPGGEHVFLEINPAGQWLFTELPTGLPISAALADLLAGLDQDAVRSGAAARYHRAVPVH